jgi:glycosyltransferase involved in cell wall biosynthesis
MRILVVHSRYRSAAPSGENQVVDQETEALRRAGHDVEMFQRDSDTIAGWSLRRAALPVTSVHSAEVRRTLRGRLHDGRYDVVHVHNTFPMLSPSVLTACADEHVPVIATVHNYKLVCASGDFFHDGSVCHRCARGQALPALRRGCYRGSRSATLPIVADHLINRAAWRELVSAYVFISAAQRDLMRGLGLPPSRVFVKHNFVAPAAKAGPEREHAVVYLGRLDDAKGVPFLMRSWDAFRDRYPGSRLRLTIAGAGPLESQVRRWAGGHSSVQVAGHLARADARRLLCGALAAIVPSQWEETFGLVVAEAMSAGTVPIATARGSLPELIDAGVDGLLVDPDDPAELVQALASVDREPDRFVAMGLRGQLTAAERFDSATNLDELMHIYRFAIKHPVTGRSKPWALGRG